MGEAGQGRAGPPLPRATSSPQPRALSGGCRESREPREDQARPAEGRARSRGLASLSRRAALTAFPPPLRTASRAPEPCLAERRHHAAEAGEGAASEDLPGPDAAHRARALPAAQRALQQSALLAAHRLPQRSGPGRERGRPGREREQARPGENKETRGRSRGEPGRQERGRRGGGRVSFEAAEAPSPRPPGLSPPPGVTFVTLRVGSERRRPQSRRDGGGWLLLELSVRNSPPAAPHEMAGPRDRRPPQPRGRVIWAYAWGQGAGNCPFLSCVVKWGGPELLALQWEAEGNPVA